MITMAMRGNESRRLNAAFVEGPLEIKGLIYLQGPQVVGGDGGVPQYVVSLFDSDPTLMRVSFERKINGREVSVIYSRISEEFHG